MSVNAKYRFFFTVTSSLNDVDSNIECIWSFSKLSRSRSAAIFFTLSFDRT